MATPPTCATGADLPAPTSIAPARCCDGTCPIGRPTTCCGLSRKRRGRRTIGMINYHRRELRERRVDVGWLLLPAHQGKGYMAEAACALLRHLFDDLGVHKVEALIRQENKPSAALAKRLGFRLEGGPIRDRWLVSGHWHSVMLYGLIAGEERSPG
ncbi:MAG: GNAT family protein [Reyranella sp.]|nr:GNAT family protein [Reyranella sp.]